MSFRKDWLNCRKSLEMSDIQGIGTQVLGPGSRIGNKYYEVVGDNPIKTVKYDDLLTFLQGLIPDSDFEENHKKKQGESQAS